MLMVVMSSVKMHFFSKDYKSFLSYCPAVYQITKVLMT